MATKKNYYYILVMTNDGPVFVTDILPNKYAEWNKDKEPKEFDKTRAEDITMGLNMNFNMAFMICSKWEIDNQPYRYNSGKFEWIENSKKEEN